MEMRKMIVEGHTVKAIASNIRAFDTEKGYSLCFGKAVHGDIVLAKVMNSGSAAYNELENREGRLVRLYRNDSILCVLGNRESGTNVVGYFDEMQEITAETVLHLLCNGGIVGQCFSFPKAWKPPLPLKILGILQEDGIHVNIASTIVYDTILHPSAPLFMVVGSAGEVGKTFTSCRLINSLKNEFPQLKVAGTKIAGTGRLRDILSLKDAGADNALDFPDVGIESTYTGVNRYKKAIITLLNRINECSPHIIIAEAGGEITWANIPAFLQDKNIQQYIKGIIVSGSDALAIKGVLDFLDEINVSQNIFCVLPLRNPRGMRLRIKAFTDAPIFDMFNDEECVELAKEIVNLSEEK